MGKKVKSFNIICIIPARGGSKGIPNKNIIDFCGKRLLQWTIEQAKASQYINDVYVTSDSVEIRDIATDLNCYPIRRPMDISGDTNSSESALIHALSKIKIGQGGFVPDIVVFLQATSPLRTTKDIDNAIKTFIKGGFDSLFSACVMEDILIWDKSKFNKKLFSVSYNYTNRQRRQDIKNRYVENGSIYIFKPEILIKNNNRLGGKIGMYVMDKWKMHEIDDYDSLSICEHLMKTKILK